MRMTRIEYMATRPQRDRKPTVPEVAALLAKHVKRELKEKNLWEPKPKRLWWWNYGDRQETIRAYCRSDARGIIKQALGIKQKDRLPKEVHIEKVNYGLDRDGVHRGGSMESKTA